jgi:hypothetical protein
MNTIKSDKTPKLLSTKDYAGFLLCQFNRNVEKTKYLEQSMKAHGFIPAYPIHATRTADGRLQIKAGHHRFEVAKSLGITIYYVISNDEATIHELEKATTTWKQKDYLTSFAKCGLGDYQIVAEFFERTGISLGHCISMFSGETASSNNKTDAFKNGTFTVTQDGIQHAEEVGEVVSHCGDCGIKSRDSIFVSALSRCLFVKEFSKETFKRRAENNVSMFKPCRSIAEQTELFESVYNRNATIANRLPLAFLTNKVMAGRNAALKHSVNGNAKKGGVK